jgi:hypothetical protein
VGHLAEEATVHHDPAQVTDFLIAALATVVVLVILVALVLPLVRKLFFFDWPPLYEWQQARRQLRRIDQWRVIWATRRNHLISRATLAGAQLAYVRYRHASAQRSAQRLPRRRRLRATVAAIFVVNAGSWAAAAARSQQRIADSVLAAGFAISALGPALVFPWSERRLIKQMTRLQREIEDRHAQVSGQ